MAQDRSRRFARLGTDAAPAETLDLFEHFGVPSDPGPEGPIPALGRPYSVLPCPACGWYRATPLVEPCPICAATSAGAGDPADVDEAPP